jgi:hypothetical protein
MSAKSQYFILFTVQNVTKVYIYNFDHYIEYIWWHFLTKMNFLFYAHAMDSFWEIVSNFESAKELKKEIAIP